MFGVDKTYVDAGLYSLGGQIKELADRDKVLADEIIALKNQVNSPSLMTADLSRVVVTYCSKEELANVVADFIYRTNEMKDIMRRTLALLEKLVHIEPPKPKTPPEILHDIKTDFEKKVLPPETKVEEQKVLEALEPPKNEIQEVSKEYMGFCLECQKRRKMEHVKIKENVVRGYCEQCATELITRV